MSGPTRIPGRPALYVAAERFVSEGLAKDGSLFQPGASVWRPDVIEDFRNRYTIQYDASKRTFESKLKDQLSDASRDVAHFVGELLFVYTLASVIMKPKTKQSLVEFALAQAQGTAPIPLELLPALQTGIAAPGPGLNQHRFWMLRFFVEFLRAWKKLPSEQQKRLLTDPWQFKSFLFEIEMHAAQTVRAALLHLVFPDVFEPIVSETHKKQIVNAFKTDAGSESDPDKALCLIRERLTPKYGESFTYYAPEVRQTWVGKSKPWPAFVDWVGRFAEWDGFEDSERNYKLELAQQLAAVRTMIVSGGNWLPAMRDALAAVRKSALVSWQYVQNLDKWITSDPERASAALLELWDEHIPLPDRVNKFVGNVGESLKGGEVRSTAVLLMAVSAERYPPYASRVFNKAYVLTGGTKPDRTVSAGEKYQLALTFLDELISKAAEQNVELRDRLDAQSAVWAVVKYDASTSPIKDWPVEEREAFITFRGKTGRADLEDDEASGPEMSPMVVGVEELADELLLDSGFLERTTRLLKSKRQIVFYGPPGTGKTYVARKLGAALAGSKERVKLVQFHAGYTYEDFVEGFRPGGSGVFELVSGPLREIADQARSKPDETFVLIIDELNRGNAAKVFGELYFLLEYRDEEVRLQYSRRPFSLPGNLLLIATMNTADRSIALIDAALRRRFFFVPFFPDQAPIAGLLARWLTRNHPSLLWIADIVDQANKVMADPHFAIGPSHFMQPELSEEWVEMLWEHSIMPYLEERYFGDPSALSQFKLNALRNLTPADNADASDS